MSDNKVEVIQKKTILDLFIDGARKGFTIGTTSLLPNVMMAFVIIRILVLIHQSMFQWIVQE